MDKLLTFKERPVVKLCESLCTKSKPTKSSDVVLYDEKIVKRLEAWLKDENSDTGFVSGPCGSGVTTLVTLLLKELGINACFVDHTEKNFQESLKQAYISPCDIVILDDFGCHVGKKELTILIDNIKHYDRKTLCIGHSDRRTEKITMKWKIFEFPPPSNKTILNVMKKIAAEKVPNEVIERIVRANQSDVRAGINALEMYIIRPGTIDAGDEFVDSIEAIESVFSKTVPYDVLQKKFEHEPFVVSGGVFDNYLRSIKNTEGVRVISENLSCGDSLSTDYNNLEAFVACSTGFTNISSLKKNIKVSTYGVANSKNSHMLANRKRISLFNAKRAKKGETTALSAVDIGLNISTKTRTGNIF